MGKRAHLINTFAILGDLRSFNNLITSAKGITDISDIPALIICFFLISDSDANAALANDITELITSATVPYVGSNHIVSSINWTLSNLVILLELVSKSS